MALLLLTDTTEREVHPAKGDQFTLAELQGYVGGYIEIIPIGDGKSMVLNEDGKALELPINLAACAKTMGLIALDDEVVGDVLIVNDSEMD